ncbi:DUF3995 domain-containing protein [Streptomyces sp. NRRL B-24484]|uniref:DUF3995 domain-containing protein n=1 Tax=Streptomyces sp. NRRL B-24484 TaxID=1463833 RepID=UPI0006939188|nr:DUF3995 domain-containing protein [Streptomyces sp. NRRL B-24484]
MVYGSDFDEYGGDAVKAQEWLFGAVEGERASAGAGGRTAAALAAAGLGAAAALHAVWTFSPWPLGSRAELATVVVGTDESRLPSGPATAAVAGLLGVAAWLVVTAARPQSPLGSSRLVRSGVWTVSGVLALRGAGGAVVSGLGLGNAPAEFRHWDLALYSPLCLALGGLSGYVAARTRRRGRRPS